MQTEGLVGESAGCRLTVRVRVKVTRVRVRVRMRMRVRMRVTVRVKFRLTGSNRCSSERTRSTACKQ